MLLLTEKARKYHAGYNDSRCVVGDRALNNEDAGYWYGQKS